MPRAWAITAGVCVAAVLALAAVGLFQRDTLAFTLGVNTAGPLVPMQAGDRVCQTPVTVPPGAGFDRVSIAVGTYGRPGPGLSVDVRDTVSRALLGSATVPGGYPDIARMPKHVVRVGKIPAGRVVDVCVTDRGIRKLALYGDGDLASRSTTALRNGQPVGADVSMVFERPGRSALSLFGDMADRAALVKFGWTGAWTFWLLGALVLLAVPALLVRAVRSAAV